jgi:hypothetical protein
MKLPSRLHRQQGYSSLLRYESKVMQGVKYAIRRVSLSQRIELTKKARELSIRHEFLRAGDAADQLEASLADLLVRRLYLEWGLAELSGLRMDGQRATVELLIEKGPEPLSEEIIAAIRAQLGLSEEERKNS